MRRLAFVAALAGTLLVGCGGDGYSEEFRTAFMESCVSSSGGQESYCECALEHLEANGPDNEEDITAGDQQEAIQACIGEVTG